MTQQQLLREGIVHCAEVFGQKSCSADARAFSEDSEAGFCADELYGRRFKITQPNFQSVTERGYKSACFILVRARISVPSMGNMMDDVSSWCRRKFASNEVRSKAENPFLFVTAVQRGSDK